jgi:hypothetical protein
MPKQCKNLLIRWRQVLDEREYACSQTGLCKVPFTYKPCMLYARRNQDSQIRDDGDQVAHPRTATPDDLQRLQADLGKMRLPDDEEQKGMYHRFPRADSVKRVKSESPKGRTREGSRYTFGWLESQEILLCVVPSPNN